MIRSEVDCWLLTGATGLVGRFVLAELLRAGQLVGALVRDRASASASARIEECLAPFESEVALMRPRTIAFDLTVPGLGISESDKRWLSGKQLGVIHSAASIRFVAASKDDEPYLSNVVGTGNLLDFLRAFDIACFHHVSTAYVSGRSVSDADAKLPRKELAVARGATGGNDYESSKIESERMIRECAWLKSKTFLRPSIIVGDSRTAYTSTFHGFYAPLQIGRQFVKLLGANVQAGAWFRSQLGLRESDTKNFVPVDWVSRAIVRVALDPSLHGSIYHLTNPQPVSCADAQTAIELSLGKQNTQSSEPTVLPTALPTNFREQMAVYESYFNSDPVFDSTNTLAAMPDLACPKIDIEALTRLADYALRVNFGWPRATVDIPEYADVLEKFNNREPVAFVPGTEVIQLQVLGAAAPSPMCFGYNVGSWQLIECLHRNRISGMRIVAGASDLAGCIAGLVGLADLVGSGRAVCSGLPSRGWPAVLKELDRDLKTP